MQTLSTELRGVIESRLRSANQREILVIASALCAQELEIPGTVHARGPQPAATGPEVHSQHVVCRMGRANKT